MKTKFTNLIIANTKITANTKLITKLIIIVTVLFSNYNFIAFSKATVTFNTVIEALNWADTTDAENRATVTKLIITGKISGDDYSESSEWSKFRTLDETFSNIEEVEILTDQDIPDYKESEQGSLFMNEAGISSNWLKSFSAPNIKYVGNYAFYECSNLISVNFPALETIGEWAFAFLDNLISVEFPTVTTIEYAAFNGCSNLTSAEFPLVTTIWNGAFFRCYNLTTVNFPVLRTIGMWAFQKCNNLISVEFPSVITIKEYAFAGCLNLTTVKFPLVTTVRTWAFDSCLALTCVNFGANFTQPTAINFGIGVFGHTDFLTSKIDLTFGENVLPTPDLDKKTWQDDSGNGKGNPYYWKSITKFSSIEKIIKNSTVSIFPNPTAENATVSFELEKFCNVKIVLCDVLGIEQMNIYDGFANEGLFTETIDTGHLSKGVYFLKILIDGNYTVKKIVVN